MLELSCERLYMRWSDAHSRAGALEGGESDSTWPWEGEPTTQIETATPEQLLDELDRALAGADTLRLVEPEWLSDRAFAAEIEARVEAFAARGGRVT